MKMLAKNNVFLSIKYFLRGGPHLATLSFLFHLMPSFYFNQMHDKVTVPKNEDLNLIPEPDIIQQCLRVFFAHVLQ